MGCFSSKNRKDKKDKCCTGCFTKKRSRPESPPEPFKPDPNLPSKQKSKSSEPFEPESKPPNSIPVQPPKLLESFPITLAGDHQSIGVFIHPGLAITVSEHLSKPEDCKSANPEAKLNPKKTFVFLPKLRVAIVATDAEGITVKVECRLVKSGEQLQVEGKRVNVSWSNRQRVYYSHEDTENVRPGTPLTINSLVVALHEKPGQGISMNWICTEISQSSASLPQELQSFFAPFKDHTLPFSNITRIYALRRTGLISFNPVFDEFTEHADKLPIGAKICDVPNGPFICGGLENNAASNKAFIYDSRSDAMMAQRTAMTVARSRHAICYANGSVYCVGGATKDAPIQICERYLLRMDKWEPLPPLPVGRVDAGLVTFRGGCFLIGGTTAGNASVLEVLQLQDTAWVSIGTPWPSLTSPVLVDSDPEFIFIFAQDLIRWVPATPPTVIYPKKANIVGCHTARVKNSSVYIFGEENLYEMRVDKDPVGMVPHRISIQ